MVSGCHFDSRKVTTTGVVLIMTLGGRLKLFRGERPEGERSREAFASSMEVSKNTIVNYENDDRVPDALFLKKIIELDPSINPSWLLTGDGEMRRVVILSEYESREALIERLIYVRTHREHFEFICSTHGIEASVVKKYIAAEYEPSEDELEKLCKVAGGLNYETGKLLTENEKEEQNIKKIISDNLRILRVNKINIDHLSFIIKEFELISDTEGIKLIPEKKANIIAFVYDDTIGSKLGTQLVTTKIQGLLRLVG